MLSNFTYKPKTNLNFLFNILKNQGEKIDTLKGQSETKSPVKSTWS